MGIRRQGISRSPEASRPALQAPSPTRRVSRAVPGHARADGGGAPLSRQKRGFQAAMGQAAELNLGVFVAAASSRRESTSNVAAGSRHYESHSPAAQEVQP